MVSFHINQNDVILLLVVLFYLWRCLLRTHSRRNTKAFCLFVCFYSFDAAWICFDWNQCRWRSCKIVETYNQTTINTTLFSSRCETQDDKWFGNICDAVRLATTARQKKFDERISTSLSICLINDRLERFTGAFWIFWIANILLHQWFSVFSKQRKCANDWEWNSYSSLFLLLSIFRTLSIIVWIARNTSSWIKLTDWTETNIWGNTRIALRIKYTHIDQHSKQNPNVLHTHRTRTIHTYDEKLSRDARRIDETNAQFSVVGQSHH